jgi:hypothetical protein
VSDIRYWSSVGDIRYVDDIPYWSPIGYWSPVGDIGYWFSVGDIPYYVRLTSVGYPPDMAHKSLSKSRSFCGNGKAMPDQGQKDQEQQK